MTKEVEEPGAAGNIYDKLNDKIKDGTAVIAIIGLGYVGLPLAIEFAENFKTLGFDTSKNVIESLKNKKSHIGDIPDSKIAQILNKTFFPESDYLQLSQADFIIICVPTPLKVDKTPELGFIKSAATSISKTLHSGQLIILESTTFPKTTEDYLKVWLEDSSGLIAGKDFGLAFSPERIDPGNKKFGVKNTPKIVGGITKGDTETASKLYGEIIEAGIIQVSNARTAEAVKLMENIFRHVNIALVNEMALVMEKLDIDVREVIDAASTKPFGFMPFYPGPGVGGHCIPLDPYYLSFIAKQKGIRPRFIELSGDINDYMKIHTVNMVEKALERKNATIRSATIGIMGLAYKGDIDDTRESPAIDIITDLLGRGAKVKVYDPYVKDLKIESKTFKSEEGIKELFRNSDVVILITNHSMFETLNYHSLVQVMKRKIIIDTRGILPDIEDNDLINITLGSTSNDLL